jgi:predicted NBD/HSP70 family sugar kinase
MIVVPSRMGQINKRTLLRRLQRMESASRAVLARDLGISQPTAGRIVDELLEAGVLEEFQDGADNHSENKNAGRMGRPGRLVRLDSTRARFVVIQFGVTETCLSALTLGGNYEDVWQARFRTPVDPEAWVAGLRRAAGTVGNGDLWGVLVSVPGVVDEKAGQVLFSPNLHWTEKVDLPSLVRRVWNLPVHLIQEERALALGHHATLPAHEDFLLVDFGEGVGGALVVGGKIYSGPLPISGELGHTPVVGNQRACGCGGVGCVETLISTRGMLQSFAVATACNSPTWQELVAHVAEQGLPGWLADGLNAAAMLIAGAVNVLGVQRVVITGSLNEFVPKVVEHLADGVVKGTMWARFGLVECVSAPRRRMAGLVEVGIDALVIPAPESGQPADATLTGTPP